MISKTHRTCGIATLFGAAIWLGAACDGALVDSGYRAEALFTAPLEVSSFQDFDVETYTHPRWAVFVMPSGLGGDFCDVVQLPDSSQPLALGATEVNLFSTPDSSLLSKAPSGARYALLRPMAFDDADDDGEKDADEPFLGDCTDGILYLAEDVSAEDGPTGVALSAGFHKTWWNGPCNAGPVGDDKDDCDVPLGVGCESDADCGESGSCLGAGLDASWPGGYCVVPATADGCKPKNGRLHLSKKGPAPIKRIWLKACESDADCRESENYICQPTLGACMRSTQLRVELGRASKKGACQVYDFGDESAMMDPMEMVGQDSGMMMSPPEDDDAGMMMPPPEDDDAGTMMPPEECMPPDPACDGMPGGGDPMGGGMMMSEFERICGNG